MVNRLLILALSLSLMGTAIAQAGTDSNGKTLDDLDAWARAQGLIDEKNVMVHFSPEVVVDPDLMNPDFGIRQRAVLTLVDTVPLPHEVYSATAHTTYEVYRVILDNRDTTGSMLTSAETRQLRAAEHVLLRRHCPIWAFVVGHPLVPKQSRKLSKYRQYESRDTTLKTELLKASDTSSRDSISHQIEVTEQLWLRKGYKTQVENAFRTIDIISSSSTPGFWASVSSQFNTNLRYVRGSSIPDTFLDPLPQTWSTSNGWETWKAGSTSGEVKIISINRPWLNADVFTVRKWMWTDGRLKKEHLEVSDGRGIQDDSSRNALMSILPTALVLTRNVHWQTGVPSGGTPRIAAILCRALPSQPF